MAVLLTFALKTEKELPSSYLGRERGKQGVWQTHNPFVCLACYLYYHCVTEFLRLAR